MEKIDFAGYNKPKHFPMWLCDGDTLKLAEYDDAQLEELDKNARSIADQYGIDTASGAELDRIGKILGEDRGGNSDKVYRIYLKLKTMLNTANGTIEDIIRFVKFFYSSETVRLVPNYPAGIRILHDGENPTLDFNRIVKQIVGSGISYDTRELFNMTDELPFEDEDDKTVRRADGEFFSRGTVYRDGRVLRDGVTILPTHVTDVRHDGKNVRNGSVSRSPTVRVPADGAVFQPVCRNSGISDGLFLGYARAFRDEWESVLYRNGAVARNGSETRGGKSAASVSDALAFDRMPQRLADAFTLSDVDGKTAVLGIGDGIGRGYRRDRTLVRNGRSYRNSAGMSDPLVMAGNGLYANEEWSIGEEMRAGIRYAYFRDGLRKRNGSITRKGDVLIAI